MSTVICKRVRQNEWFIVTHGDMGILTEIDRVPYEFSNSTHSQYTALSIPFIHDTPTHHILNTSNDQDEATIFVLQVKINCRKSILSVLLRLVQ